MSFALPLSSIQFEDSESWMPLPRTLVFSSTLVRERQFVWRAERIEAGSVVRRMDLLTFRLSRILSYECIVAVISRLQSARTYTAFLHNLDSVD